MVTTVSLTVVGPYSKLRPQSNAALSKFWMPETSAAISLFHRDLSSDVNGCGLILVAADGGAWTMLGVSTRRTLNVCKLWQTDKSGYRLIAMDEF